MIFILSITSQGKVKVSMVVFITIYPSFTKDYVKLDIILCNNAQKNQSFLIDLIINVTLVRRFYLMEQMKGVEPSSQPWQGRVLAVKPHLQIQSNYIKKNKKNQGFY